MFADFFLAGTGTTHDSGSDRRAQSELYDVVALPGVTRPMALGFKSEEIQRLLAIDDEGTL
jgi:hypothetical protein